MPIRALHDVSGGGDGPAAGSRASRPAAFGGVPRCAPIAFLPARAPRRLGARGDGAPAPLGRLVRGRRRRALLRALRRRPRVRAEGEPRGDRRGGGVPGRGAPAPLRHQGLGLSRTPEHGTVVGRIGVGVGVGVVARPMAPRRGARARRPRGRARPRRAELSGLPGARRRGRLLRGRRERARDGSGGAFRRASARDTARRRTHR